MASILCYNNLKLLVHVYTTKNCFITGDMDNNIYNCYHSSTICLGDFLRVPQWMDCCLTFKALSYKLEGEGGIILYICTP